MTTSYNAFDTGSYAARTERCRIVTMKIAARSIAGLEPIDPEI